MMSWIKTTLHSVCTLFGWSSIADERLTPEHGWLLPATVRARRVGVPTAKPEPRG